MLIKALCDYYDMLSAAEKVLPEGYSKVKIHYEVALTEEGEIDHIINIQKETEVTVREKNKKEISARQDLKMPQRTEKPGIAQYSRAQTVIFVWIELGKRRTDTNRPDGKGTKIPCSFCRNKPEIY